ncbi:DUF6417 family protein [Streptomyces sp. NPDC002491]
MLPLDEAHDLLRVLRTVAQKCGTAAGQARCLVRAIGARYPRCAADGRTRTEFA